MAARTLEDRHKRFIVQRLAWGTPPSDIAEELKTEFGVKITRQTIRVYDPRTAVGRSLGEQLRALFWAERELYAAECDKVALLRRNVRVRELERLYEQAFERGNSVHAAALLEQIAKEDGGLYTNRRQLTLDPAAALSQLTGIPVADLPTAPGGDDADA